MKFLTKAKDGGYESTVTGYWLIEIKSLFSIVLLKFEGDSRDAYHNHAFNCFSWVLSGGLCERFLPQRHGKCADSWHWPSWRPFITKRTYFHKVSSIGTSWVLSIRGPWRKQWQEYIPSQGGRGHGDYVILTEGRKEVYRESL